MIVLVIAQLIVNSTSSFAWDGDSTYTYEIRLLDQDGEQIWPGEGGHAVETNRIAVSEVMGDLPSGEYTVQVRSRSDRHPDPSGWKSMVVEYRTGPPHKIMVRTDNRWIYVVGWTATLILLIWAFVAGRRMRKRAARAYWIRSKDMDVDDWRP